MKTALGASCAVYALLTAGALIGPGSALAQNAAGPDLNATPVAGGGQGQSQGGGAPNQPSGGRELETIVVTAQKRTENAQKIPAIIATISPAALSRSGVNEILNIQKVLPDVTVFDDFGNANLAIRGVRLDAQGPTADATTAVHLDGLYLSRASGLAGLFYDLQRVEELPGPQGTLYGRNAVGGVINLITNRPTDIFGGYVEAEGGNYGLYRFNGALNLPVSDRVQLRGAFREYHHDGYFSNGLSDADQQGGRLSARVRLTPAATVLLSADYQQNHSNGFGTTLVGATFNSSGGPPLQVAIPSDPFKASPVLYPVGVDANKESSFNYGAMAQFDYDFGPAILTAQVGTRRVSLRLTQINLAASTNAQPCARDDAACLSQNDPGLTVTPASSTTYSGEVRLASTGRGSLQWVAGLFYFTEKDAGDYCATFSVDNRDCLIEIGNPFQRTISYAGFGQFTYTPPILDRKFHLTLGGRYNLDQKHGAVFTKAVFAADPNGYLANLPNIHQSFQAPTYKVELSYDVTPANLVYVQNSTGFRAGGIAYGGTPIYKPEQVQAYEIGSKNRFLENRLQVNVSGYHYVYKNQETNVMSPPAPGVPAPFSDLSVQSIGKAHYTGATLDVEYALTPDDRLQANVQYLQAYYVRFQLPPQYILTVPLDLSGNPTPQTPGDSHGLHVPNTPPWTGTFSYDHTLHALGGAFDGQLAVQFSDVQHYIAFPLDTLQYKVGTVAAYARLDLSVNYQPDHGQWQVTAYVNNVTNAYNFVNNQYENAAGSGLVTATLLPPRTFGAIMNVKF